VFATPASRIPAPIAQTRTSCPPIAWLLRHF
jgi:hypothetical protein